jgi:hypothetical protein
MVAHTTHTVTQYAPRSEEQLIPACVSVTAVWYRIPSCSRPMLTWSGDVNKICSHQMLTWTAADHTRHDQIIPPAPLTNSSSEGGGFGIGIGTATSIHRSARHREPERPRPSHTRELPGLLLLKLPHFIRSQAELSTEASPSQPHRNALFSPFIFLSPLSSEPAILLLVARRY